MRPGRSKKDQAEVLVLGGGPWRQPAPGHIFASPQDDLGNLNCTSGRAYGYGLVVDMTVIPLESRVEWLASFLNVFRNPEPGSYAKPPHAGCYRNRIPMAMEAIAIF